MAIETLLLERKCVDRKAREEMLAVAWAEQNDLPYEAIGERALAHRAIGPNTLCVGTVGFIRFALQSAGLKLPAHIPYPEATRPWLHRHTGFSPALRDILHEDRFPIFVKPAEGWKRFTGLVLNDHGSLRENRISIHQSVYWSDPVVWRSEWRAYVAHGQVVDAQPCPGTTLDDPHPDAAAMAEAALALFENGGPSGLVMDFGVLASGETALIETNDAFSFGAYGNVTADAMAAVWTARWPEYFDAQPAAVCKIATPSAGRIA